jgi:hypothetical protein
MYLYETKQRIIRNVPNTEIRVRKRSFLGDIFGMSGLSIFSVNRALGARSVPEAVDIMAERSAQKNIICKNRGVDCRMNCGSTRCMSPPVTSSGAKINAAYPRRIGTKANIM